VAITIRDVAQRAGVSTATVSRALRGLPNVDEQTRERVKQVAAELDYVISPSASRLASGRTGSIAVVTPYIARWFFGMILSGVESVLQNAGMDVLLMSVGATEDPVQNPVAPRLRRRVDGVLVLVLPPEDEQLRQILDLRMPTSLIGVSQPGVTSVTIDDVLTARIATQHLLNLGHRRIGIIGGQPIRGPFTAEHDRNQGFLSALADAGISFDPLLEAFGYFTIHGGEQAMTALLTLPNRPTAVLCMSDEMAYGAMRALRSHGLTPGVDISLVGIDGHDMSEFLDLTTVAQPVADLGRIAAESLLLQIQQGPNVIPANDIQLPTQLIVRGSTAPLRRHG
jgi:LacI family transcriptional regulator, repressor for deo operon, udp, cdd, tsx, nupC, and nupG